MNRHNSHQQPEATANNANAKQWQIDVPKQGASKVGNYGNASDVNSGKNANDINHTSDQGETVKVRVIKGDRDEPNNDEPGQVEQGGRAGQTVRTDADESQYSTNVDSEERSGRAVQTGTEAQPKKRGIIELLGSSPLGIMAQTALDSVRHSVHEIQVDRQIKLIDKTAWDRSTEEQERCNQLNRLVDEGRVKLRDGRVLKKYLSWVSCLDEDGSNTNFINKLIQENKVDLSKPDVREVYLKVALSAGLASERLGVQEAINTGKLDLSNEEIADQFLGAMSWFAAFNTNILKKSSISPERIVNNDHIQEIAVEQMVSAADRVHNGKSAELPISSQYQYQTVTDGGAYLADVLEKVCSSEGGRQCLVDSINKSGASVQELGELFEKMETDILGEIAWRKDRIERGRPSLHVDLTEDTLSDVDELFANMATDMTKYNDVLKGLGWEPFKKDESLINLFYTEFLGPFSKNDKKSIEIQDGAYKLGLITPEVTDRLYNYQFKELFNATKGGSILGRNDNSSAYTINPDLVPSGEDVKANYWHEQSKFLGDDAMRLCMVKALNMTEKEQDDGQRLDLSDLIDEDGILKDAFFQNRPGSFLQDVYDTQKTYDPCDGEEYARVIRFLEAHKDQTSEADGSRAIVDLLDKMKNENGGYDVEAIIDLHHLTDLADNYAELSDANGLKPEVWQDIFSRGGHLMILRYYQNQDEAGRERMGLDDKQMTVARGYGSINKGNYWNDSRKLFDSYIKEHYDELTIDQIKWMASIVSRLVNSNASELAERSEAFTSELLKLDADKIPEALDKIEDIYIHNHLPYVGKNYLVFRTMHPSPNLEDDFNFSPLSYGRPNTISPVLQQATGDIRSGKLDQMLNSRDTIIVSDLLRASFGSNNRSIREYLTTLKNGQALFDRLNAGELDWDTFNQPTGLMDKDTKANYDILSTFVWHLATIYNSTLPGKEHPYQLIHQQTDQQSDQPNALQTDFTNLTSLIKPNGRYSLADRAVRYFAHFVGIEDLAGAERYMDNIVKEADARNRKTAEYLATTKEPKLQPGDLVKGMGGTDGYGIRYLSYAFQNGSISKEYLGDASRSDTTPLDADASIVLDLLNGEQTINQVMASMLADGYGGGLWVVLRPDKDRFIITRRDNREADQSVYDLSVPDANFDRTDLTQEEIDRRLKEIAEAKRHRREGLPKLEIFATGVDGSGHYGVRTGFGMNLVSFCVTDSTLRDSTPVSEVTKLEVALNGFYIPVVDRDSEELIFTPDDYDKMRQQMSGLSYYRTGDYQFAPDSDLELGELTLDKKSLSAVSAPTTSSTNSSSSSTSDDAQGASSNSITIPSTTTIISELPASMAETDHKHEVINQAIKQAITGIPELNLSYKDYLDGDLTENIVEMIDTGSTGRQTNAPGSGDFDYLARLDRSILNDPTKKQQITDALLAAFGRENDGSAIVNGNLRLKQVSIDGLAEPVDIDITFAQKTNKVQYPTDAALADRLSNIKNQSETKYRQVLANIIYAKQFLKAAGAYKPRRSPEAEGVGGLGGVGIENWVLQHGGSFKQAARDFLAVADSCSNFEDFCAHYPVWDYGENHKGIRSKPHDNFVADNMNQEGYERMKEVLRAVVN
ncbi:hypothetical protein MBN61_00700 [Candidatus Saccharibacteria bacterium]|nr:hypothetical protein [Candidatus Saccharibacteria bacterium]